MIYHIRLEKGEVWRPKPLKKGAYRVVVGSAWVTYVGVIEDIIVSGGEKLPPSQPGMVVEALEELIIEIAPVTQSAFEFCLP